MKTFSDAFRQKVVEPRKRLRGGSNGWVVHRFSIRGGISIRDAMLADLMRTNPVLVRLLEKERLNGALHQARNHA